MSVIKFPLQAQPPRPKPFEEIVLPAIHEAPQEPDVEPDGVFSRRTEARAARELAERGFEIGQSVAVISPVNRALSVAGQHRFFELCQPILWGEEASSRRELFGELLRSLVVTFLPEGLHDLFSLKAVAAAQWRLNRLLEIQSNLFSAHSASQEHDSRGLPRATSYALEVDEQIDKAQKAVTAAVEAYHLSRRMAKKEAS